MASTNAIIAGMLVEEAVKISTYCICSTHDLRVAQRSAEKEQDGEIPLENGDREEEREQGEKEKERLEQEGKEKEKTEDEEDVIGSGIQDYVMYMGQDGVYTHTFEYAKKPVRQKRKRGPRERTRKKREREWRQGAGEMLLEVSSEERSLFVVLSFFLPFQPPHLLMILNT